MRHGKPIIGIAGGIGSGKTFIARLFGESGCMVISSDEQVDRAYRDPLILEHLRNWWGDQVARPDGTANRRLIADRIFNRPEERARLEGLLHPYVARLREEAMAAGADDPQVLAYVWDTPLLFETGLDRSCDTVVFVEAPPEVRLARVQSSRGWDRSELLRRENLQTPLDRKRELSEYVVTNTADATRARSQVREVLSRILVEKTGRAAP